VIERHAERLAQENATLKERLAGLEAEHAETRNELETVILDLRTKQKEDSMLTKLRDSEHLQLVAEMRRRIAELELQNADLLRAGQQQLHQCSGHGMQSHCISDARPQGDGSDPSVSVMTASYYDQHLLRPNFVSANQHRQMPNEATSAPSCIDVHRCRVSQTSLSTSDLTPTNEIRTDLFQYDCTSPRQLVGDRLSSSVKLCAGAT
jgi:uncharacterized protein YhaN